VAVLNAAQIPAMPACDLADVPDDPHLVATGFFGRRTHPTEGDYLEMRPPVRFGAAYRRRTDGAPGLGQHTEDVRRELTGDPTDAGQPSAPVNNYRQ
jgi:crotonobetainyl-CoA:carnitine CoA-transferase CaiB-like acyl-CoA transferase